MKLQIEKGIPIPPRSKLEGIADVLREMEIGDSFVIPTDARTNMKGYAARVGIKVVTQKLNDKETRVWRSK